MNKTKVINPIRVFFLVLYYSTFYIPMYPGLAVYQMYAGSLYMGVFFILITITIFTMYFKEDVLNPIIITLLTFMLSFLLLIFYGKLDGEILQVAFYLQIVIFLVLIFLFAFVDQAVEVTVNVKKKIKKKLDNTKQNDKE